MVINFNGLHLISHFSGFLVANMKNKVPKAETDLLPKCPLKLRYFALVLMVSMPIKLMKFKLFNQQGL